MKRQFDVILSSFALLMLSPLLLIIAVLITLDSPGQGSLCGCNPQELSGSRQLFCCLHMNGVQGSEANHG